MRVPPRAPPPTTTPVALRQADFTSIALASVVASEAYGAALPRWFRVGSLVAASRFPLLVSAAHCAASELAFLRRARGVAEGAEAWCLPGVPRKRRAGVPTRARRAPAAAALAGFFFVAEEAAPDAPFLHAAWHCFGAAAIHTGNAVALNDWAANER